MNNVIIRFAIASAACIGLVLVYVFQQTNLANIFFGIDDPRVVFYINRTLRFLINDFLAISLVYALFCKKKFVVFAICTQLFGVLFLLFPYFALKYYLPTYNGPLINFLHRLILNPTLVLLLIPAFYYQRKHETKQKNR